MGKKSKYAVLQRDKIVLLQWAESMGRGWSEGGFHGSLESVDILYFEECFYFSLECSTCCIVLFSFLDKQYMGFWGGI